jgi:hypothetical protein
MKLIIGTGGCGFQRIHQIMNRLGQNTLYKISPVKMQNSIQVDYNNFINKSLLSNRILIGSFYLNIVENIITKNSNTKVMCFKGDKKKTVESLFIHFGHRNPLISDRSKYSRYNLDFFYNYFNDNINSFDAITKYYDDYYNKCDELKLKYPNNFIIVESKKYFEDFEYQKESHLFFNIENTIVEEKYFISDKCEITTSLHGGLGNNLFQIIEPLVFTEIHNLPAPVFSTWNCSELPSCNNSDIILGGHGGTWEDFNNSFSNINFTEPKIANFDTKFMINDMFDFGILVKYRDIILNKFSPSDNILEYINNKYKNIFIDSCSLHIRTWTSSGDVHSQPLDPGYYDRALSIVNSKNILVFTDNVQNCYNILNPLINKFKDKNFRIIDENQFVSLFMISMCDMNIVNISTFSFWGAFLNKKQENNIIIPSNFGHGPNMISNLNWIKI